MKLPTSSLSFLIIVLGVLAFSPIEAKLHDQQVQELSMQQQQQQQQYYYSSPEEKRAHYWRNLQESTAWRQIGLDINGQRAADLSGFRVAMSDDGTRIAVSSLNANSQNIALADTGSVRVFQFSRNVEWNLLGQQIFGERAGEAIGEALHLSGDGQTLAFGSIKVFPYKGLVRVYRFNTQSQTWIKLGADIEGVSDRDRFGAAIDMSYDGNTMIVGGPFHDGDNTIRGHAVVFEYDSAANTWNTIGLPDDLDGRAEGERAGTSVAMNRDGSIVAVGAPTAEPETNSPGDNTGLTRVYQRTAFIDERNPWQLMGSPISGTVASEQNGFDVDLSDDGLIVAMGSPMYTFPAVGGRPAISLAGMARVFEYVNNAWVPRGSPITATAPVANQFFGRQVALSSDGYVLAVSAPYDKQRGSVAVYEFDDTAWSITPGGNVTSSQTQDLFGNSVALSGDGTRMVVGAAYADPNALVDAGRTEAFEFQTSTSGWSLKLDDVTSNFGAEDTPEFTFIFSGTAPPPVNDLALRYTAEILFAGCQFGAPSDNSVRPVSPTAAITASEAFRFTPQVEVDSATVTESGLFTDTGNGEGSMAYCLRIEVFDGAERKVFKEVDMNVRLDMSQDFEVRDFETTRLDNDKVNIQQTSVFNYTLDASFCDEFGVEIPPGQSRPVAPGERVNICIDSDSQEGAQVVDLISVSFENFQARLVGVDLINENGQVLDESTTKECEDGGCFLSAVTVPSLYEYVDGNGNIIDVSGGVYLTGEAVYEFSSRRRHRQLQQDQQSTTFTIKLKLESPPDRSTNLSSASVMSTVFSLVVTLFASWMVPVLYV